LHYEELCDEIYRAPSIVLTVGSRIHKTGHAAAMGETRNEYRILVRKTLRKRTLGMSTQRWGITLRWILDICALLREVGASDLGSGPSAGFGNSGVVTSHSGTMMLVGL
jgi:hypothetical protein